MAGVLEGQVAVITGASRGIGLAIGKKLASLGASIACVSTGLPQSEAAAAQMLEVGAPAAHGYACNVADMAQVEVLSNAVLADFGGRADILVNNAGLTKDTLLLRMSEEDFDRVLDVNLKGVFHLTKAFLRTMARARYGRIVNISSVVGLTGNPGQANYAASKAGIIGFGMSVAREMASRNITVNMIAPGFIETDMTAGLSDAVKQSILASIPLGRMGKAEEIAGAVAFLVGPDAGYITGQVLGVDGGLCMR